MKDITKGLRDMKSSVESLEKRVIILEQSTILKPGWTRHGLRTDGQCNGTTYKGERCKIILNSGQFCEAHANQAPAGGTGA